MRHTYSTPRLLAGSALALCVGVFATVANARSCDRIYYGTELVDDVTYCASSVLPNSRVANYRAGNLESWSKKDLRRAWCEGARGSGAGSWIELKARPGATIRYIQIHNGYQKSKKSFRENARARDIVIQTDTGLNVRTRLKSQMGAQKIWFNDWYDAKRIRVTIKSVYAGSKYKDLCISGFAINFEDYREFEYQMQQEAESN